MTDGEGRGVSKEKRVAAKVKSFGKGKGKKAGRACETKIKKKASSDHEMQNESGGKRAVSSIRITRKSEG